MVTTVPALRGFMDLDDKAFRATLAGAERRTRSSAATMNRAFGTLDRGIGGVSRRLLSLNPLLAGLSAAAIFGGVIRSTRQFEKELAGLSAITGATGKDLAFLEAQAKRLGRETTRSAADTLTAFKLIASAKPDLLANVKALDQVTEAAITLSEASGEELPAAAGTLTTALNQFQAGADQAARFINVLAAGAQKGAVEVGPFSTALTKAGTVAHDAGISFEQFTATVQTLATFGTPLEQIGTSVRNVLLKMQEGSDATNPKVVGLTQALLNLGGELKTTADFTKRFGLENVVVAKQMVATADKAAALSGAITGTNQAYDQAATRTDNLSDDLDKLGNAFVNLGTSMGGLTGGPLRSLIQGFTEAINETSAFIDEVARLQSRIDELRARPQAASPIQDLLGSLGLSAARFPLTKGGETQAAFLAMIREGRRRAELEARGIAIPTRGPSPFTGLKLPPPAETGTGGGGDDDAAKKREAALKAIEATIAGLEQEARLAGTVAGEREKLAAILGIENAAREGNIVLTDEQRARVLAAIATTQQQALEEEKLQAIQARETALGEDVEDLRLRLRFAGQETEEFRVQARLLEIRRDLGEAAAASMETEVRQAERLRSGLAQIVELRAREAEQTDRLSDAVRDLGLSFESAFEDAIINGEKLSDILTGLEQDLLRLGLRKLATEPLFEGLTLGAQGRAAGEGLQGLVSGAFASLTSPFRSGAVEGLIPPPPPKPPVPEAFMAASEEARGALEALGIASGAAGGSLEGSLAPAAIKAATETITETAATTAATTALGNLTASATAAAAALSTVAAGSAASGAGSALDALAIFGPGPHRQHGGPVQAGRAFVVGEAGPELFVSPASGTIVPNERAFAGAGMGARPVTIVINNPTGVAEIQRNLAQVRGAAREAMARAEKRDS
ncbi:MAG TPA: phage tail tape measure protein [Kiloniellales bacterium]